MHKQLCLIDSKYIVEADLVRALSGDELARPELSGMRVCAPNFAVPQVQHLPPSNIAGVDNGPRTQVGLVFQFSPLYLSPTSLEYLRNDDVYFNIYWNNVDKARDQQRLQASGISIV